DDVGGDAALPGGEDERLRMVAGGVGDHPTGGGRLVQGPDRVGRAAKLERAGLLEVLTLEEEGAARQPVEGGTGQHRGPVRLPGDARRRGANGGQVGGGGCHGREGPPSGWCATAVPAV